MPVTDVTKDIERRTFAITAEFAAPVERVWALYAARGTGTSRRSTSRAASPFRDGFADADLNPDPDPDLPVSRNDYTFTDTDGALTRCSPAPSTPPKTCRR